MTAKAADAARLRSAPPWLNASRRGARWANHEAFLSENRQPLPALQPLA